MLTGLTSFSRPNQRYKSDTDRRYAFNDESVKPFTNEGGWDTVEEEWGLRPPRNVLSSSAYNPRRFPFTGTAAGAAAACASRPPSPPPPPAALATSPPPLQAE